MLGIFRAMILAGLAVAVSADALPSRCAGLPTTGPIGSASNTEVRVPPQRHFNGVLYCQDRYRLITNNGPAYCVGLAAAVVMGNPQAECYASLKLGPVAAPSTVARRPTTACPSDATSYVLLSGSNLGWSDIAMAHTPFDGVSITHIAQAGPATNAAENSLLKDCAPQNCRMLRVRATMAATTAGTSQVTLRLNFPGRPAVATTLALTPACPAPLPPTRPVSACARGPGVTPTMLCP